MSPENLEHPPVASPLIGRDENVVLTPSIRDILEQAMRFIEDDEPVEITPSFIRLRKRALKEQVA